MIDKMKVVHLLKSRHSVAIYFDNEHVYLVRVGRFKNKCYRLMVQGLLRHRLMTYALDGSYILYRGSIVNEVVSMLLRERFKWQIDAIYEVE
ncbi:hypothetical protein MKL29_10460 [Streptococcus suis]|nr:hypothetical protein [Streptococcus suis]